MPISNLKPQLELAKLHGQKRRLLFRGMMDPPDYVRAWQGMCSPVNLSLVRTALQKGYLVVDLVKGQA